MALKIFDNGLSQITFEDTITGSVITLPSMFLGYTKEGDYLEILNFRRQSSIGGKLLYTSFVDEEGNVFSSANDLMSYLDSSFGEFKPYLANTLRYGFTSNGLEAISRPGNQQTGREIKQPKTLSFNGVDQYGSFGNSVGNYTNNFTISFWLKTSTTSVDVIFARKTGGTQQYQAYISESGALTFGDTARANNHSLGIINDGTWKHIVLRIAETTLNAFTDGAKGADFTVSITSQVLDFWIGANGGFSPFQGEIAYFKIFNTALSDADITKLYNHEQITTKPVNAYNFEEESGDTYLDSGTGKVNGIGTNSPSRIDAPFQTFPSQANRLGYTLSDGVTYYANNDDTGLIASGVVIPKLTDGSGVAAYLAGGAIANIEFNNEVPYNFAVSGANYFQGNGVDRYINLGNTFANYTDNFTLCFWVKPNALNATERLISKRSANFGYYINVANDTINFFANAVNVVATSNQLQNGVWSFVAVRVDNGSVSIQIGDNMEEDIDTIFIQSSLAFDFVIFRRATLSSNFFDGGMSMLSVYNSPLSNNDINNVKRLSFGNPVNLIPFSEGNGNNVTEVVSNTSYSVINPNSSQWQQDTTGQLLSYNLLNGYSLYEHATLDPIIIPFDNSGNSVFYTPPTGYTKTGDYPANNGSNGAETVFIPPEVKDLYDSDSGNFLYDATPVAQEISYDDFVSSGGAVGDKITYNLDTDNRKVTNLKIKQ